MKNTFRKLTALVLSLCLLAGFSGQSATVYGSGFDDAAMVAANEEALAFDREAEDNSYGSPMSTVVWIGNGDAISPYRVTSAAHLLAIPEKGLKAHYIQTVENIDLANIEWTPIGNWSTPFLGVYNGNGYTISNLTIEYNALNYVGLFGCVGNNWESDGTLRNITLEDVRVVSAANYASVGSLAGINYGTIMNCHCSGEVTNEQSATVGGLVGENEGIIENCSSAGTVSSGSTAGGLAGCNTNGIITKSSNASTVNGLTAGGLLGSNEGMVEECTNSGTVSGGDYASVGGLVGCSDSCSYAAAISNSSNSGAVSGGDGASVGGLVGYNDSADLSGDNSGTVSGGNNASVGGLAGLSYYHSDSDYYHYKSVGTIADSNNSGSVTVSGGFSASAGGLVGSSYSYIDNATIINSKNTGDVDGGDYASVGGLVGELTGQNIGAAITDCINEGNVTGQNETNVGGLVGYNMGGSLSKSTNKGNVVGGDCSNPSWSGGKVGGLAGEAYGVTIEDCHNNGAVSGGKNTYTGGLAGYITNQTTVDRCTNSGDIGGSENSNLGGLVGYVDYNTTITDCISTGDVSGDDNTCVGGLAGYLASDATVDKSTNNGSVYGGVNATVGGLVGEIYGTLTNSSSTGRISGGDEASQGALTGYDPYSSYLLDRISITSPANKTNYVVNEPLSIAGLVVTGYCSENNTAVLPVTPANITGFDSRVPTEGQELTITYEDKTATYTVDIKAFVWQGEGSGTSDKPYQVTTPQQLDAVRYYLNNADICFTQTADIDLSGCANWQPIGYGYYDDSFAGTYDGGGKTISSLIINDDTLSAVGLFGYVKNGATLKNIRLNNVEVVSTKENGWVYVGGLAGNFGANNGVIENCSVEGLVKGTSTAEVGGLTGSCKGTVRNSFSSGTVKGTDNLNSIGGLVGSLDGSLESCYSTASVCAGDSTTESKIHTYAGGLVGTGGMICNCYCTGSVTVGDQTGGSNNVFAGGLIGGDADISTSYSTGNVNGGANTTLGGLVGVNTSGTDTKCYYLDTSATASDGGTAKTDEELRQQTTFENWDFTETGTWRIIEGYVYPVLRWQPQTVNEDIAMDTNALNWNAIKGGNSTENNVTTRLNLITTGAFGTTISWVSSEPEVVANDGTVTRPSHNLGDKDALLTATVSKEGGTSQTKDFLLTIKAIVSTGGGGTPAQTPAQTPTITVDLSGNIAAGPELNSSTSIAATELDADVLASALKRAAEDSDGKKTVSITISPVEGAKAYKLTLPASTLNSTENMQPQIETEIASVTLPNDMLEAHDVQGNQKVSLTIARADMSGIEDEELRNRVGDRPVIQLGLEVDGEPYAWSNENAPVVVSIPYTPSAAELLDPEHIVVWYIDGRGNLISVPNGRYDPTTGTVTFTTTHFSRYAVAYVHKSFSDLQDAEWARKPIEIMASKGIVNGTAANTFSPQMNITRADYLVLLIKTLGLRAEFAGNFDDVKQGVHYYEAVGIAKKLGIALGADDNRFHPEDPISREDMMTLTARALEKHNGLQLVSNSSFLDRFSDKEDVSIYTVGSMATLVKEGLITGSGNRLNPRTNTTRAEAVVFLYRIYSKYQVRISPKTGSILQG